MCLGRDTARSIRSARARFAALALTVAVALLAMAACEGGGSVGGAPISRCVPPGACDDAMFQAGITAAEGDAERGRDLYATHCTECHGEAGVGVREAHAIDMTTSAWQARMGDAEIVRITRTGRPPVMPSFRLSEDELRDLLAHIRTFKSDADGEPYPGGY